MESLPVPAASAQRRPSFNSRRFAVPYLNARSTRLAMAALLLVASYLLLASHQYNFESALYLPEGTLSKIHSGAVTLMSGSPRPPAWDPQEHHALIYTWAPWHEEVWLYLSGTLAKMGVEVDTYTENDDQNDPWRLALHNGTGVRYNLLDVASQTGMLPKPLKEKKAFLNAVNTPLANGRYADVIFLATEMQDMEYMSAPLLEKWHQRPADQKFRLVPVLHELSDGLRVYAPEWAKLGALSYITLSQHVAKSLEYRLQQLSRHRELSQFGLDEVKAKVATPLWPVQELVQPNGTEAERRETHRLPSQVIVAGKLEWGRRDYIGLFTDIQRHLELDAKAWGYRWDNTTTAWERIDENDHNTFRILLTGEKSDWNETLTETRNLVEVRRDASQYTFYQQMATTDILLRAWWPDSRYYESQCSGSAVRSIETATPMLITHEILQEYTFLDDNTALVRPDAISDIDAIALFRRFPTANVQGLDEEELWQAMIDYNLDDAHPDLFAELKTMLERGWRRSVAEFDVRRKHIEEQSWRGLQEAILGI